MGEARYDAVADFYVDGWSDAVDDPAAAALLVLLGTVAGARILDVACGHGRISRELARRGAQVVGVDISGALIARAGETPGVRYVHADLASNWWDGNAFDAAVCNFGLSDIDDPDGALAAVAAAVRPGGRFVFSIVHPCFPGGGAVSGSWPTGGRYHDEGWWRADGAESSLRRRVGAHHRTLSTYVNVLRRNGFWLDELAEPAPPPQWHTERVEAARFPVFLVARCLRREPV